MIPSRALQREPVCLGPSREDQSPLRLVVSCILYYVQEMRRLMGLAPAPPSRWPVSSAAASTPTSIPPAQASVPGPRPSNPPPVDPALNTRLRAMEESQGSLQREFSEASRIMKDMMGQFDSLRRDLLARRESNPPVHTEENSSLNQVGAPHQQVGVVP